ncbi:hypothetical protein, partial [Klebsiella pneumoniae]|uniref:hypothetical protein n=1 Tax=Klebsiella pneumoniae TaxID=573 RepID=UPI003B5C6586
MLTLQKSIKPQLKTSFEGEDVWLIPQFSCLWEWSRSFARFYFPLQDLDAQVERVRKQFDVPGIAIAIVKDGQVVLE